MTNLHVFLIMSWQLLCFLFLLISFWQFLKLYNQFYQDNLWANCVSFNIEVAPTICAIWPSCKIILVFLCFNIHFCKTILCLFNVCGLNWIQTCVGKKNTFIFTCDNWKVNVQLKRVQCELSLEIIIQNVDMAIVDMAIQLQSKFLWNIVTLYTTY